MNECDVCQKFVRVSTWRKFHMDKNGWLIYCKECADKINIKEKEAKESKIFISGKAHA